MTSKIFSLCEVTAETGLALIIGFTLVIVAIAIAINATKTKRFIKKAVNTGVLTGSEIIVNGNYKYTGKDAAKDVAKSVAIIAAVSIFGGAASWRTGASQFLLALSADKISMFPAGDTNVKKMLARKQVIEKQDVGEISLQVGDKAVNATIVTKSGLTHEITVRGNKSTTTDKIADMLRSLSQEQ